MLVHKLFREEDHNHSKVLAHVILHETKDSGSKQVCRFIAPSRSDWESTRRSQLTKHQHQAVGCFKERLSFHPFFRNRNICKGLPSSSDMLHERDTLGHNTMLADFGGFKVRCHDYMDAKRI